MRRTVMQIRQMLDTLPDDLTVDFRPISDAWLGSNGALRFADMHFYNEDGSLALPSTPGAVAVVHLLEDRAPDD